MGEEEKKTEEKKHAAPEEVGKKIVEGNNVEKKEEDKKPDKIQIQGQAEDQKKKDKEAAGSGGDDSKDAKDKEQAPPPPPPPQEIVLKVYMHCEGCARKVCRSLRGFDGVEDVITDCKSHKVVVKGEKADPLKVLARIQKKSHRQVELLSPIPKPRSEEPPKQEEKEGPKLEEKKEEPQVITVVLKVHMHCEACSQKIKKRILRMKGVESVEADLKSSEVTVKGVFEAQKLVEYVYRRTGKHAVMVKQEPPPEKKEEDQKVKDDVKEEKKGEGGGDQKEDADQAERKENGKEKTGNKAEEAAAVEENGNAKVVELIKNNELSYYNYPLSYPPKYAVDILSSFSSSYQYYHHHADAAYYPPPPQFLSDENPNACSIM